MDYAEARQVLACLPFREVKPGLSRIRSLLSCLGNPERTIDAIHIAGTNGKGSVTAMLASVLSEAGYRVGRYTSPEVIDFRDRIAVDGQWISKREVADLVATIRKQLEMQNDYPTLFEALTAIAFRWFTDRDVDYAVVEAGLGGRFDATNVVSGKLAIITNIGRDHSELLGDTITEVAWEKSGIAKKDTPLIAGGLDREAEKVVRTECDNVSAQYSCADIGLVHVRNRSWSGVVYDVEASDLPSTIELALLGGFQRENLAIVLESIRKLRQAGCEISSDAITRGLIKVRWPARFEVIAESPRVILDGAHNLSAARKLATEIESYVPTKNRRHLLFGVLVDKDISSISKVLFPSFGTVTLTKSSSYRSADPDELEKIASSIGVATSKSASLREALDRTYSFLGDKDTLLVTGSITVAREARALLVEDR